MVTFPASSQTKYLYYDIWCSSCYEQVVSAPFFLQKIEHFVDEESNKIYLGSQWAGEEGMIEEKESEDDKTKEIKVGKGVIRVT